MNQPNIQVPGFQEFMLPFLKVLKDGETKHIQTIIEDVIKLEKLSPEQCAQKLNSGATVVNNRIAWVRTYLYKAGLIDQISRGNYTITQSGKEILETKLDRIDIKYLKTLPKFQEWLKSFSDKEDEPEGIISTDENKTPQETLEIAFKNINDELATELLDKTKSCSPNFFEHLVVDLILAMGYGGLQKGSGTVTQMSNDGGVDGIISEDKLGLDIIYIQAKRWENTVTVSAIRDFAGSLLSKKARKGVFITTSNFPKSAYEFVASIDPKISLIDGVTLAKLMIEYNVGVSLKETYQLKKIDNDYFEI